ncbi:S1/P1 nuclease [Hymenobacter rubripertinctus]|uniref:S1/P1 nuclease n=1 Tax=Hymenobacter rubripertinctus TaxID=2029981 RepID=UPI003639BA00
MRKLLFPLLFLLLTPLHLWAWGADGHRAIAKIAERHLSRAARREIQQLLGPESFPLISTWPDEIRYYPEGKDTAPWHYVNTASGLNHDQYVQALNAQTESNAYQALQNQLRLLSDSGATQLQRLEALKYVVHIVGDIHQPLHAGHAEDKGGNDIKIKYRGRDTNLHSLWDSGLLDYQGLTYTEMARQYDCKVRRSTVRRLQSTAPAEWLWESYQASEQIYREVPNGTDVNYAYYPAHAVLMRQRIEDAGIRLAGLLNELFG